MVGMTPTISKARLTNKCDGCGRDILKGSFYISMAFYANLWYRFHFSTICRAKAILAREVLADHEELTVMKNSELIEWLQMGKPNDKVSDSIAQELGFKNRKDAVIQVKKLKDIPHKISPWVYRN